MMGKMCGVHCVAWVLLLVGGLNWGLVGLFDFNLVEVIFGSWPVVLRVVYVLVGLSAVMALVQKKCAKCVK